MVEADGDGQKKRAVAYGGEGCSGEAPSVSSACQAWCTVQVAGRQCEGEGRDGGLRSSLE